MNMEMELKIQAWLDGELSPTEAAEVAVLVTTNAEAQSLVTELKLLKAIVRGNEQSLAVPESREFYWSKIERAIITQAEAAAPVSESASAIAPCFAWARNWLAPATGLAAMIALLLVVAPRSAEPEYSEAETPSEGGGVIHFKDPASGMTVIWFYDQAGNPIPGPDSIDNVEKPE
jgi:anti-sigma factor RsiW